MLPEETQQQLSNYRFANIAKGIAILSAIIGLFTSTFLYASFGYTPVEKIIYSGGGLVISLVSLFSLTASHKLYTNDLLLLSLIMFLIYISALFIEYNTNLGFSASSQENVEKHSKTALLNDAQILITQDRIKSLSKYQNINIAELVLSKKRLNSERFDLKERLSKCPAGFTKNCINPIQVRINKLTNQLDLINVEISNGNKYEYALKSNADLSKNKIQKPVDIHPLFKIQSRLVGSSPQDTQAKFLSFSSFISTIISSVLFLVSSALRQCIRVTVLDKIEEKDSAIWGAIKSRVLSKINSSTPIAPPVQQSVQNSAVISTYVRNCEYAPCAVEFTTKVQNKVYCCDEHKKSAYNLRRKS